MKINIHVTGGDIRPKIAMANAAIAGAGLKLELIDAPKIADVRVSVVKVPGGHLTPDGRAECEATSIPLLGEIEITPNTSYLALLHELFHCAGVAHEDDRLSIMYHEASYGAVRVKPEHIKALRRLSGITRFGRLLAQFRAA